MRNNRIAPFISILSTIFVLFTAWNGLSVRAQEHSDFAPDEVIVTFKQHLSDEQKDIIIENADVELKARLKETNAKKTNAHLSKINSKVVKVPPGKATEYIDRLKNIKDIESVSLNYVAQKTAVTNDPSLSNQWGLYKIEAAKAGGQSAWDISASSSSVRVAVLDTGIQADHPDLTGKVVQEANFTTSSTTGDIDGHGTHVAGTVAAQTNNGIGVAGVGYNAALLNGKVLGDNGSGYYDWIASGIIWATDQGARVINMSLGGSSSVAVLENAVNYAWDHGVVVVAAAGNSNSSSPLYPAYYTNSIATAATTNADVKASWSSYGNWVDIAAPGDSIYATYKNNGYAYMSGTSMATPIVSGVAALLASNSNCNNVCIRSTLQQNADPISGTGTYWQNGRVNAYRAVSALVPTATPTPSSVQPTISPTQIPSPTPTIAQNTMTVSTIDMWFVKNGNKRDIYTRVTVINQITNQPLYQAQVSVKLINPQNKVFTGNATTNSQGQVTFVLKRQTAIGNYTSTVTGVTKSGFTYSPTMVSKTLMVN